MKTIKNKIKCRSLPDFFKPLLWSYDFGKIDPSQDRKTIIINSINYGDLKHWRWMYKIYGLKEIQNILTAVPATEIRPRALRLASIIFQIKDFNYAPRGIK